MTLTTRVAVGLGGAALALMAGSGIASAAPGDAAIVNSTCTYPQVIAALTAEDPVAAGQLTSSPIAVAYLQDLVNTPPSGRQAKIDQVRAYPQAAQYSGLISQVANTCNNY
ncbi:hemophore-related protein [Mycolicibacterium sp. 050158]|jgi:hemophore-related protein|uniref:hemophore-related protein n=1 Tax=Mycolicibacterium sp. 050158 TaxID=3090602 RepID=UPI00299F0265|nr:hemophore-related protein [Mycolicibacterium sp. 050158]MDX1893353.1 hemophore-related protein [Mycolicibacterium sp. 050158]